MYENVYETMVEAGIAEVVEEEDEVKIVKLVEVAILADLEENVLMQVKVLLAQNLPREEKDNKKSGYLAAFFYA